MITHTHTRPQILIHKQKVYFARLALSTFPRLSFLSLSVCLGLSLLYPTFSFFLSSTMTLQRSFSVQSFCMRVCLLALIYRVGFACVDHHAFVHGSQLMTFHSIRKIACCVFGWRGLCLFLRPSLELPHSRFMATVNDFKIRMTVLLLLGKITVFHFLLHRLSGVLTCHCLKAS